MKRILVVNVNWVGDVVFSSPVFKVLKRQWPDARVSCLAVPRVKEVLDCCPGVDEVIVYDERGRDRGLLGKIRVLSFLRKKNFDGAFILHRSWSRALLVFLAGVKERVGYDVKRRGVFLTHKVPPVPADWHRSDVYLHVPAHYGLKVENSECRLRPDPQAQQEVAGILSRSGIGEKDPVVMVNVGGNWDLKRWPIKRFSDLLSRLKGELTCKIVLPGAPQDCRLAQDICRQSGVDAVVLAGQTSLTQLVALLQRADVLVSADSGPLHIASAVGTRGVAIFGPTRPEITGPRGPGHFTILQNDVGCNREPCYFLKCPDNVCMQAVTVDEVMAAVHAVWAQEQG